MKFRSGTTTVLAVVTVSGGSASYTTASLKAGIHKLTAVYSGGGGYAGSTSSVVTYVIGQAPSVTVSGLPATVRPNSATLHPFTVVVTNPSSGGRLTHLFLKVALSGINNLTPFAVVLQYQDTSGTWCNLANFKGVTTVSGYIPEVGSSCASSYPASFSLAAPGALTVHMRVGYPTTSGILFYGKQMVTASLYTGTCTASGCTSVAPLTGSAAPSGSGTTNLVPPSPLGTNIRDIATRPATSTVRKTFDVALQSTVEPKSTYTTYGLPAPTGTVKYEFNATPTEVVVRTLVSLTGAASQTPLYLYNSLHLKAGTNTVTRTYSGDAVYAPSTLTQSFTVTPTAPTGTPFMCMISSSFGTPQTVSVYVEASGKVPAATLDRGTTTSVDVTNGVVTLTVDPAVARTSYNTSQTAAALKFVNGGSSVVTVGPITFQGTTGVKTEIVGAWSDVSVAVPVASGLAPGTKTVTGTAGVVFRAGFNSWTCVSATATVPAVIGTTEVAGTVLSVNPDGSATAGSPVQLTASVYPRPSDASAPGTVTFFDGSKSLELVTVVGSGTGAGTAQLTTSNLTPGLHALHAEWTGNDTLTVPANISNVVTISIVTAGTNRQTGKGYWEVATDGGIFSFGNAAFYGSMGGKPLNQPIVGIAATPDGKGYWEVASDGGIFSFGNAAFYGSMGGKPLNQPIVGMAATPDRQGLLGGGHRRRASSASATPPSTARWAASRSTQPIVGIAATPDGKGYWEVATDGGIFASATPPSTARWAASRSTSRSSAWPPRPTAGATGRWPPTAASSLRQRRASTARWAASR